jgi:acetate kinase
MSGSIAVINAGSSSIKFAICTDADDPDMLFQGRFRA